MSNIVIQKATIKEFKAIKEFMLEALDESPFAFSVDLIEYKFNSDDWWNNYLAGYFYSLKDKLVVAVENNRIVGMVGIVYEYKSRRKHVANIVWMYVKNENRGLGIAKKLINEILNSVDNSGIKKLSLMVNATQKPAIKLYESVGFKIVGRMESDLLINNEYVDTIIMEKVLT